MRTELAEPTTAACENRRRIWFEASLSGYRWVAARVRQGTTACERCGGAATTRPNPSCPLPPSTGTCQPLPFSCCSAFVDCTKQPTPTTCERCGGYLAKSLAGLIPLAFFPRESIAVAARSVRAAVWVIRWVTCAIGIGGSERGDGETGRRGRRGDGEQRFK